MQKITKKQFLEYPHRILIAGTRSYDDVDHFNKTMQEIIEPFKDKSKIAFASGGASSGADKLIIDWCKANDYPYCVFKANWEDVSSKTAIIKTNAAGVKYNSMAGFDRNEEMAAHVNHGFLFWDKKSPGTKDMLARLKAKHIPYLVIILTENHFNTQTKNQRGFFKGFMVIEDDVSVWVETPRVLNKYRDAIPEGAVSIMRPSKYGNPYVIGVDGTRDEVIDRNNAEILADPKRQEEIKRDLKGKHLVCCCAPKRCHGDLLLKIANSE